MNSKVPRVSALTAAVCATALAVLGAPAGFASAAATGAQPDATLTTSSPGTTPPPDQMPVATGDPRHAGPPRRPGACLILRAALSTTTGEFSSADEASPPDTGRIQAALDRCAGTGRAVELAAGFTGNAFLSGPLTIGRHEVLLVDDGVTLYASLNPADYQVPGQYPANTCGTVSAAGGGCYPFITFAGSGSGLMGTRGPDGPARRATPPTT